jgi:hypothetical protein
MQDGESDPRAFRSPLAPPAAEDLYAVIEAHVTQLVADAKAGDHLTIEYHTPNGTVLHVTGIGYISRDLLVLDARDPKQQACQILVHPSTLQLVMTFEQGGRPAQRHTISFLGDRSQPTIRGTAERMESEWRALRSWIASRGWLRISIAAEGWAWTLTEDTTQQRGSTEMAHVTGDHGDRPSRFTIRCPYCQALLDASITLPDLRARHQVHPGDALTAPCGHTYRRLSQPIPAA